MKTDDHEEGEEVEKDESSCCWLVAATSVHGASALTADTTSAVGVTTGNSGLTCIPNSGSKLYSSSNFKQ